MHIVFLSRQSWNRANYSLRASEARSSKLEPRPDLLSERLCNFITSDTSCNHSTSYLLFLQSLLDRLFVLSCRYHCPGLSRIYYQYLLPNHQSHSTVHPGWPLRSEPRRTRCSRHRDQDLRPGRHFGHRSCRSEWLPPIARSCSGRLG